MFRSRYFKRFNMSKIIIKKVCNTFEIKKSKFVCVICPMSSFEQTLEELKKEHPKGRHFVYAYRYLNDFDQIVENQSDDGEPKGSSGPPVLSVIRGEDLINTAAIIVRYFGGIKLGVGGLIRAYGRSTHLALEKANEENLVQPYIKSSLVEYKIEVQDLGKLEHFCKKWNNLMVQKTFCGIRVNLVIEATQEQHVEITNFITKLNFE